MVHEHDELKLTLQVCTGERVTCVRHVRLWAKLVELANYHCLSMFNVNQCTVYVHVKIYVYYM